MNPRPPIGPALAFILATGAVVLPVLVFLVASLAGGDLGDALTPPFWRALGRSSGEAVVLAFVGFGLGWPLGTVCGLQRPRGGAPILLLLILPMAVPPYLWAVAVQALRPLVSFVHQPWLDGFRGVVLALAPLALPLPLLAAWGRARRLPASQIESLWLAAGPVAVIKAGLRTTLGAAVAGALLAAALVVSDPGCDQIMGCHGFSSEVLIAFAVRIDFAQASAKALAGALVLGPIALVSAYLIHRDTDIAPSAQGAQRAIRGLELVPPAWLLGGLGMLGAILLVAPLAGLLLPLLDGNGIGPALGRAGRLWMDRAWPSLQRPLTGAVAATVLGSVLAMAARACRGQRLVLALAALILALPSIFSALGWVRLVGCLPRLIAPVQSGGWLVGVESGLRMAPMAAVLLGHGLDRVPRSSWNAAKLSGLSARRWWIGAVLPEVGPLLGAAAGIAGVLTAGEMHAELMLQPPGGGSFSSHIFSVMDNSSAITVAALAVLHLLSIWALLGTVGLWIGLQYSMGKGDR